MRGGAGGLGPYSQIPWAAKALSLLCCALRGPGTPSHTSSQTTRPLALGHMTGVWSALRNPQDLQGLKATVGARALPALTPPPAQASYSFGPSCCLAPSSTGHKSRPVVDGGELLPRAPDFPASRPSSGDVAETSLWPRVHSCTGQQGPAQGQADRQLQGGAGPRGEGGCLGAGLRARPSLITWGTQMHNLDAPHPICSSAGLGLTGN